MTVSVPSVERIPISEGSGINFGAIISGIDIEHLTGKSQSNVSL